MKAYNFKFLLINIVFTLDRALSYANIGYYQHYDRQSYYESEANSSVIKGRSLFTYKAFKISVPAATGKIVSHFFSIIYAEIIMISVGKTEP